MPHGVVNVTEDRVDTIKVPLNVIMYIESINRKIYLHSKRDTYLLHCYKYMDLIEQYSKMGFVQIHRTCIVNLKYVFCIDDIEIRLDNGKILPLSRRRRRNVFGKFLEIETAKIFM